jgi:hypothetical protein
MVQKFKHRFKKELKRQSRLALTAAIGFIIAFAWKDSIMLLIEKYVKQITTMTSTLNINLISSIIATVLGVLIILLSSRILED